MTANDLVSKLQECRKLLDSLQQFMNVYEGQLEHKDNQIKLAEVRLQEVSGRLKEEQSKSGSMLSKASDEVTQMRREAADLLDRARIEMSAAKDAKRMAEAATADATERTKKLQRDEQAFSNSVQLYERKKQALEQALKQ